jgi:hypothetical protein
MPGKGLQESVAIKISVFAVTDGLRPIAAVAFSEMPAEEQ